MQGEKRLIDKGFKKQAVETVFKKERLELHETSATGRKIYEQMLLLFPHGV